MDPLVDDRELLDAYRRGEKPALTRVYLTYAEDVFSFLRRGFVFNAADQRYFFEGYKAPWRLEGVVQDVFIRAFSDAARLAFDGLRPFRSYLFTIARNLVMDRFRKERPGRLDVREIGEVDEGELLLKKPALNPEQIVRDRELRDQVERYTAGLNAELKALFEVRFIEGLCVEETARRLRVSEYQVKRDEKRIKKQFFQYMRERGYFRGYTYGKEGLERLIVSVLTACARGC